MTRLLILGISLVVGCKDKHDETCERAVDIAIKCDVATFGGGHNVDDHVRDNMLGICKRAFDDTATGETAKIQAQVRAYAECKAKAEGCDGYQRCESLLE